MVPFHGGGSSLENWKRVAVGLELVLKTMAAQKVHPNILPSVHHVPELLASFRIAADQAMKQSMKQYEHVMKNGSQPTPFGTTVPTTTMTMSSLADNIKMASDLRQSDKKKDSIKANNVPLHNNSPSESITTTSPDSSVISPQLLSPITNTASDNTSQSTSTIAPSISLLSQIEANQTNTTRSMNTFTLHTDNTTTDNNSDRNTLDTSSTELETTSPIPITDNLKSQHTDDMNLHPTIKEGTPVPSTRTGRALGFASLGLGLVVGTVAESARRLFQPNSSSSSSSSLILNDNNSDRLASSLCRMRGAALKMGQMLSIQDESLLPDPLVRALQQVRQGADAMPRYQLEQQLQSQFGKEWRHKFVDFDMNAFAAASIGQVHRATIRQKSTTTNQSDKILPVVVKVQYPGVAQSIESDLRNLAMLVTWSGLAPKGLFIENVIRVGRDELKVECQYRRELQNQQRIKLLVESDPILVENQFRVPNPIEELTTDEIITSEYIPGGTIDKALSIASQQERNRLGHTILYLTMKELFEWRFMQTDPNWGNFLYDATTRTTGLIDFGATREYSKSFVDGYLRIVYASATRDETTLMEESYKMGFLTGQENDAMLRAHKLSGYTVGEPFYNDSGDAFDFRASRISERMGEHTAVFLQHRLTAPPEEVYTLHRKLAGAYMLCIKLGAIVDSPRRMLESIIRNHTFDDGKPNPVTGQ